MQDPAQDWYWRFPTAQFVQAASALGISHSHGCSHRHLSIDVILGCCSTSLEQPVTKKWPRAAVSTSHVHRCIPASGRAGPQHWSNSRLTSLSLWTG